MHRFISLFAITAIFSFIFINTATTQSFAQSSVVKALDSATDTTSTSLPSPLTRKAIRDVLSGLSDAQARELLIKQLDKQVSETETNLKQKKQLSMFGVLNHWGKSMGQLWLGAFKTVDQISAELNRIYTIITSKRTDRSLWAVPITLITSLIGAFLVALIFDRLTKARREKIVNQKPTDLKSQIMIVAVRLFVQTLQLLSFIIAAFIINSIINRDEPMDHSIIQFIIGAIGWTLFAAISARFVLSPARPDLRLISVDCTQAKFLSRRAWIIFGFSAFFVDALFWSHSHGWLVDKAFIGFWISLIFYLLIAQTFWQGRKGITQMVIGHVDDPHPSFIKFADNWPVIAMILVMSQWIILGIVVATGNTTSITQTGMKFSLIIIIMAPIFRLMVRAIVKALWPIDEDADASVQAAHQQTQEGLIRFGRILVGAIIIILFAKTWNIDLQDLASKGVGAQIAGAIVEIFLIVVVAYGLWEVLNILSDRQIALDKAEFGSPDEEEGGHGDGPGGMGGSRLGTLMPLIRGAGKVVISVLATLAILGQMGVNITPLLAGAGIIGMAVAFGAQTLVKDVFSGIFFLIDDAFRKGEYLDVGSVRGTVEKISVRSMQLRHHNGPLNTVPFGSIDKLTNYSRDWAIMKLSLRLTYDTDADKVRKMIKKLGQRLLEHPEFGPLFVEPLKSQGVRSMEDSAMIMRIKFTTKPGDQFTLRRFVLDEVRKLFDANGIKFANREVTVHLGGASEEEKNNLTSAQKLALAAAAATAVQADDDAAAPSATPATEGI